MNNLCTLFNNLCKNNVLMAQDLSNLEQLITSVVKADLESDAHIVKSIDSSNFLNDLNFTYWMNPDWLNNTADNKQVKLKFTINTQDQFWAASAVISSQDGDLEVWGYVALNSGELEKFAHPVQAIMSKLKTQYCKQLVRENAKQSKDIAKAFKVLDLLAPHVEKINEICKKHKVTLYSDRNLDGTNVLFVVPNSIEMGEANDGDKVVESNQLPYIDLNARGFDSNYDYFLTK